MYHAIIFLSGKCNMNIRQLRFLCIKTLNDLNPSFMKEIFEKRDENRVTRDRYKLNLNIPRRNQVTLVLKALSSTDQKFGTLYQLISKLRKTLMLLKI